MYSLKLPLFVEVEAGGIALRSNAGGLEALIIHRETLGDTTFPKGHVEQVEFLQETAVRETLEESGWKVELTSFITSFEYSVIEEKDGEEANIIRRVYWCLAEALEETDFDIPPEGRIDSKWVKVEKAMEILTYENDKETLEKAITIFEQKR